MFFWESPFKPKANQQIFCITKMYFTEANLYLLVTIFTIAIESWQSLLFFFSANNDLSYFSLFVAFSFRLNI